jgi:3-oxoacyl-[acyl-carrier-protein] synthase II
MNRVVVTGIGAVSPLGNSFYKCWEAAKAGLSGIALITRFDTSEIKWKVAGELKGFDVQKYLTQKEINRLDPFVHYAVAAAMMAAQDAGLIPPTHPSPSRGEGKGEGELLNSGGVIVGSSRGGISTIEKSIVKSLYAKCKTLSSELRTSNFRISPYLMPSTTISMASSYIAQKLGMKGYCLGVSNACSSGTNAIGEAYRLIRSGYHGPVFCGGTEAPLCRICIEGYGMSGALSRVNDSSASRPFDITRDGFVLSEGACILVLENYEDALKRGARIYGEIVSYGNTTDAFHQTIPAPEGEAMAIKMAINEAGLKPEDIDFINAHGTSTPLGDKIEIRAIKVSFGKTAYQIPITSIKSMTGHMLAASGSLEAAFTLMGIYEGIIPPTINLKERDPECDLDYATELRKAQIEYAISHSFGFGGVNAVLVMRKSNV